MFTFKQSNRHGMLLSVLAVGVLGASVIAQQAAPKDPEAAKIKNPVATTPESIEAGKKVYDLNCAGCHGLEGRGGVIVSVIEDQGGKQPPPLNDDAWDWGATDGEVFAIVKKGVPPQFFMAPWDGRISDTDIWNVINYMRSLATKS